MKLLIQNILFNLHFFEGFSSRTCNCKYGTETSWFARCQRKPNISSFKVVYSNAVWKFMLTFPQPVFLHSVLIEVCLFFLQLSILLLFIFFFYSSTQRPCTIPQTLAFLSEYHVLLLTEMSVRVLYRNTYEITVVLASHYTKKGSSPMTTFSQRFL